MLALSKEHNSKENISVGAIFSGFVYQSSMAVGNNSIWRSYNMGKSKWGIEII